MTLKPRHVSRPTKLARRRQRSQVAHVVRVLTYLGVMLKNEWHRRQPRPPLILRDPIGKAIEAITHELPEVYFGRQTDPMNGDELVMVSVERQSRHEMVLPKPESIGPGHTPVFMRDVSARSVYIEGKRWASGPIRITRAFLSTTDFGHVHGALRSRAREVMQMIDRDEAEQRRKALG